MTREEEIMKAARVYANGIAQHLPNKKYCEEDFIAGAEWADSHPHWISIEGSLPKEHEWFLGYSPLKSPLSSIKIDVYNFDSNGLIEAHCITHWMHLPQPPKEGGEE